MGIITTHLRKWHSHHKKSLEINCIFTKRPHFSQIQMFTHLLIAISKHISTFQKITVPSHTSPIFFHPQSPSSKKVHISTHMQITFRSRIKYHSKWALIKYQRISRIMKLSNLQFSSTTFGPFECHEKYSNLSKKQRRWDECSIWCKEWIN